MKKIILTLAALCVFFLSQNAQATCDISSSFTDGQVLTAGQLNTFVTSSENCVQAVLDGDTFTGTMSYHSGADAVGYSDTGTTKKWELDSATGDVILSPRTLGTAINCEVNYSAGTITISGRGGAALSATNPCHVGIRSNSNGVVATATFTANVTTTDGAASDTDGNIFGITDANWANAMPMFIGVIYDGTTPYFTISRKPLVVSGGAAGALCQEGDTDCDGTDDVMLLTTGLTLASWVNLPVTQVAWISATYATAGGAWTFAESAYTGFNQLYETRRWTMPLAQQGAAAGTYFQDNGGTAPVFTTNNYAYQIDRRGVCRVYIRLDSDGGTDGAGAVDARIALPYSFDGFTNEFAGMFQTTSIGGAAANQWVTANLPTGGSYFTLLEEGDASIQNGDYSNGGRDLIGSFSYYCLAN